ncbi:MAG: hypothetical protein LBC10_02935, partial [Deltaproteobacteria bacterium]|nr:hypothetical protein [Deltaproteobacteria bacterium]
MQTFPSPPPAAAGARNVSAAVAGAPASGNDAHGFSRMIRQHLEGRPAQVTPLMHNAMDSNPHSVVRDADEMFVGRSPYLKTNTQHGAARGAQEIRFTPVEVRKIARALQESGVEPAVAQVITNLADNPLGLTASDMLKAMAEVIHKPARITDGDMLRIASLLQGLDPDGGLSGQIVADVRSGQATQAWQKILGALNALDPGSPVVLERDEIVSLGKSLGLSDQTLDALHKAFGGNRYIELRPNQVEQFLTPLQHELGERQAQAAKLAAVFEKALSPVAQEARMRIAAEESAMARAARSTQHAAVLIKDTVTRNGLTRQDAANAPQAEAAAQGASARNAAASRNAANASQAEGAAAAQDAARNGAIRQNSVTEPQADSAAAAQRLENLSHRGGSDEAAHGESRQQGADTGNQNQNQKSAWADFLDRVRYQDAGTSHQSRMNDAM